MCINFVHFQNIISLEAENNFQIENPLSVNYIGDIIHRSIVR